MKTVVILKKLRMVVDFDFTPEDDECGYGAEAEINTVHVANFDQCAENNIEALISATDRLVIESACIKAGKTEMRVGAEQ